MKRTSLQRIADRLANWAGYVSKQINITGGNTAWSLFSHPPGKQTDYLGAFKSWVYACVKARATDASRIRLTLLKANRKTGETEEVTDHDVLSLLRRVNPWMTFRQLIEYTISYKLLAGEAIWFLVRAGKDNKTGTIRQIWMLRPDWLTVKTDAEKFVTGYIYRPPGGDAIDIPVESIIHHKTFNPTDAYRGMSIIRAAAAVIDKEQFSEEYQRKFYQNSAIPAVVLSTEQKLDDSIIKRMREQWYAEFGGIDKAHRVAILEGGLEIAPFSVSQKDMELVSQMGFDRDKILAIFETPKSRLGMTEGVTVSNAEATDYIFAKVTRADMEALVDTLNEFLLPKYGDGEDMFFEFDDPVPENVEAKMRRLETAFRIGAMSINEIRQEMGKDPIDGLDTVYIPINMIPATNLDSQDEEEPVKASRGSLGKRRIPPISINQKISEAVADRVSRKVIATISKDLKDGEAARTEETMGVSHFTNEQQEAYWKAMVAKSINFEAGYERKLKENFARQEAQTITRLHSTQKALTARDADKILYRLSTENEVTAELMLPYIKQILEDTGNDALDFVGIEDRAFEMSAEAVRQFVKHDGLKGLKHMNKITRSKLRKVLAEAIAAGTGIPEIASQIREVFKAASANRAEMVARTEVLKATNTATVEAYKQSNVVVGKQWFTAIDERVCQWCAPMHGRTKALDVPYFHQGETFIGKEGAALDLSFDEVGSPPLHPNCRCTVIPILRR